MVSESFSGHILENVHLFTGTKLAAGLALLESGRTIELSTDSLISVALDGAFSVVENIFIFLPAASASDYCFKMILPTKKASVKNILVPLELHELQVAP